MMRVPCTVILVALENDGGYEVESVLTTCSRCENVSESYGTSEASIRRCLVLLRETCPRGERNYYFDADQQEAA
jgi:hypothetical protein